MTYETFLFILKNKILVTLLTYLCTLLYLLPLWQTNKHLVSHSFMEKRLIHHGKNHQKPRKRLYLAFLIPFLYSHSSFRTFVMALSLKICLFFYRKPVLLDINC